MTKNIKEQIIKLIEDLDYNINASDAPPEYSNDEAYAWVCGFGKALEKIKEILNDSTF